MHGLRHRRARVICAYMIEKVGYSRPISASRTAGVKQADAASGAAFAEALSRAEGVGAASGVEAPSPVASAGGAMGLLGIQEVGEQEVRRRKAVKKGRATLDVLSNLRDALLMGSLPVSTLRQLEQMVEAERADAIDDPALKAILDEIELRAAVELAKLEMAGILI